MPKLTNEKVFQKEAEKLIVGNLYEVTSYDSFSMYCCEDRSIAFWTNGHHELFAEYRQADTGQDKHTIVVIYLGFYRHRTGDYFHKILFKNKIYFIGNYNMENRKWSLISWQY